MRVVLVGRRPDGGHRDRLWAWCGARWRAQLGWPVAEGYDDREGPFCLALASNRAAAAADLGYGRWRVALYVGADIVLGDAGQALAAAEEAEREGRLVFAHDHLNRLGPDATEAVLAGRLRLADSGGERHPNTFSAALAVPRDLWDAVGGFDERFVGWGWDDIAFWASCWALAGSFGRVSGEAYHLWHPAPRDEREGQPHHAENEALGRRYLDARQDREGALAIIEERAR